MSMNKPTTEENIIVPAPSRSLTARLRSNFLTGIFVTAPIVITFYIAFVFFSFIDGQVRNIFPDLSDIVVYKDFTVPGVGVVIAFAFFVVVGWFASNIMGRFLLRTGEYILDRIPVIRNLYATIKQIFETITKTQSDAFRDVVMLEYPRKGCWSIGFVTGASKGEVQKKVTADTVNVFVPTTPNPTSGFLLFVQRKELKFLDMSVEEGVKLVVSAGIISPEYTEKSSPKKPAVKAKAKTKVATKKSPAKKAAVKKAAPKKAAKKTAKKKS